MARQFFILSISLCYILSQYLTSAKIFELCEAAREVRRSAVPNSMIKPIVCLMKSESQFNSSKITGPGYKSSFSHGILQINSAEWCNRYRPGGTCQKKCDAYLNDDIQDDLTCANTILKLVGLKQWKTFERSCKDPSKWPDISKCFGKDFTEDVEEEEDIERETESDYQEFNHPQDEDANDLSFNGLVKNERNESFSLIDILKKLRI